MNRSHFAKHFCQNLPNIFVTGCQVGTNRATATMEMMVTVSVVLAQVRPMVPPLQLEMSLVVASISLMGRVFIPKMEYI